MDSDHHVFRLAGTGLCRMHRREFRDQNFLSLWTGHDRQHMRACWKARSAAPAPASAITEAIALDSTASEVEITLLPLRGPEGFSGPGAGAVSAVGRRPAQLAPGGPSSLDRAAPRLRAGTQRVALRPTERPIRALAANDL
jgi:hypothetical protein